MATQRVVQRLTRRSSGLPSAASSILHNTATAASSSSAASSILHCRAYTTQCNLISPIPASAAYATHSIRRIGITHSPFATLPHHPSSSSSSSSSSRFFHSSASSHRSSGESAVPVRTERDDYEWDKLRKARDPFITTLDPATNFPRLPPNELEINKLAFQYGLPPLPTISERMKEYAIEQSYYDRRDQRIKDHLDRLLRMKKLSKKEMLILIDQIESSHWNLTDLQKVYLPEVTHALNDENEDFRKTLRLGTGGQYDRLAYLKRVEEKKKRIAEHGPKIDPKNTGQNKYGYRKDLANFGPEFWDYLTPYVILEAEARQLSNLDGAFRYEDRYILWEEEQRNLALAAKLQRMKMLGIPLEHAETLPTPDNLRRDHIFPSSKIRRALVRHLEKGGSPESKEFWQRYHSTGDAAARRDAKLLARKEAKTLTAARRNIPEYIKRFEKEKDLAEIDVGASTVLAQNLYIQSRIAAEAKKPSLLTRQQQESCKALLGLMAQRNRLALRKIYLSTRNQWESMMIERALEKKYLDMYATVGSDNVNSLTLIKLEQEVMLTIREYYEKFTRMNWELDALNLRDLRLKEEEQRMKYTEEYTAKMEELMEKNGNLPDDTGADPGGRGWIADMIDWEANRPLEEEHEKKEAQDAAELKAIDHELDTWNEFFDVQVAEELGRMVDSGEVVDENNISTGNFRLAEMRVSKRLNATRNEWKSWTLRPQYEDDIQNMYAPTSDPSRSFQGELHQQPKKTEGQLIIDGILKSDATHSASARFKQRLSPTLAQIDRAEYEEIPGTLINGVDEGNGTFTTGASATGSGTGTGSSNGTPSIGGAVSDLDSNGLIDPTISSAGHKILDIAQNPADRRAAYAHVKGLAKEIHESLRGEAEDPMMALLNEHALNNRDGRLITRQQKVEEEDDSGAPAKTSKDPSKRNKFTTTNPRLGFSDDDFRLYDPVLMKLRDPAASNRGKKGSKKPEPVKKSDGGEGSLVKAAHQTANQLRRRGQNIFANDWTDPVYWIKERDREHRKKHFLDLDPFGPSNTDERRDFDDQYLHLDEEQYAYKRRIDPETEHERPLTNRYFLGDRLQDPFLMKYELNDETCELLYILHRSDPVKWTPRALAHKFQITAERAKSTLILQAIHHKMVANGVVHPLMLDYNEERAIEDLIRPPMGMIHETPELQVQFLPDYRWVREDDLHRVLAEQKDIEDRFLNRSVRLDRAEAAYYAKWGAIGDEPPAEPTEQPLLDERVTTPLRTPIVMIDISEMPAARYAIAVRHRDGTLREPDEKTYQFVRKREKGNMPFTYVKYHKEQTPM